MHSIKELENIKNSLKYWDISENQKQCVINLVDQICTLRNDNNELYHFKQTAEFVLNKESIEIIISEMKISEC